MSYPPQPYPQGGYPPQQGQYPQPSAGYGQPQAPQPYYGQPVPMPAQQPGMVLVSPNAGGFNMNGGAGPQAQMAMTGAGLQTVGMPAPIGVDCPPGLEYFSVLDHIWVKELPQLIDQITSFETNQKYQCLNNQGQQVYWSQENTDGCTRNCFGSRRPFHIDVFDPSGKVAMKLDRPYRCNSICCLGCLPINCCCLQDLQVLDCHNNVIGHVVQKFSLKPSFDLIDGNNQLLGHIRGPFFMCQCYGDIVFHLYAPGNSSAPVGSVTKKWGGLAREIFLNNADNFAAVFPIDWSVSAKALVFAATFLLDFMYFEDKKKPGEG